MPSSGRFNSVSLRCLTTSTALRKARLMFTALVLGPYTSVRTYSNEGDTVEPLYKGHVGGQWPLYKGHIGDSGASLQGTQLGQWSLSTRDTMGTVERDTLGTVEPLYKGHIGDSGASLQGTRWGTVEPLYVGRVEPLYKGHIGGQWSLSTRDMLDNGASLQGTGWE